MKKEVIGYVRDWSSEVKGWLSEDDYDWTFENGENRYNVNVVKAIDELLGIWSKDGDKFKITIEKLN